MVGKTRRKDMTWRELLEACRRDGLEAVIKRLEAVHAVYEQWQAAAWGEPEQHSLARRLQQVCLKQDETLIKLRQMTPADVELLLSPDATIGGQP